MDTLDAERIVVETDCENPKTICVITNDEFIVSDGYRVRIKPKQRGGKETIMPRLAKWW